MYLLGLGAFTADYVRRYSVKTAETSRGNVELYLADDGLALDMKNAYF